MLINDEQRILRNIQEQNQWWVTNSINKDLVPSFKRNEYSRIKNIFFNEIRRFPVLSGPRRVGKSTIMFQLIDELLEKRKVNPLRILFYTLDDFPNDEISIKEVIRIYKKYVYSGDDFYLFIDEAQKDKSWKACLKTLFDLNKQVRAMISGSSSIEIESSSDESGSGRFITIRVPTLSFYEFCKLNKKEIDVTDVDVFKMHTLSFLDQNIIYVKIASLYDEFIRYLKLGGFPEYSRSREYNYVSRLIRDQVVTKSIRIDIPKTCQIRDVDTLSNLYSYFCYHSSDLVNVDTLSTNLGIDRATCNQYILALEKANLIYISEQLNLNGKKSLKPRKKIYVSDYGIRCAVTRINDIETDDIELGHAIETVSLKHTKDYFSSLDNELYNVGFSRMEGDKEIDIVIQEQGNDIQYVEAKYRKTPHIKDSDGIVVFGLEGVPGYVISKNTDDFGLSKRGKTELYRMPAIAYFYLLGKRKQ